MTSHSFGIHAKGVFLVLLVAAIATFAMAGKVTRYTRETNVPVYSVKVGPFENPSVGYHFHSFPLCKPTEADMRKQRQGLADKLEGSLRETSLYAIKYRSTCHSPLSMPLPPFGEVMVLERLL